MMRMPEMDEEAAAEPVIEEDYAYGNSGYNGSSYGNTAYDEPVYGEDAYDNTGYGETAYDDSAYGENAYEDNTYGEPFNGENTSGEPAFGEAVPEEEVYSDYSDMESSGDDPACGENAYEEPELSYAESETEESADVPVEAEYTAPESDPAESEVLNSQEPEEEALEIEDLDDDAEEPPVLNHLMIEARTPEKGLKIAVEALKQIHNETGIKNPVAKITGEKLSRRGVLASAEKLAGKDLVIEEAGDLTPEALEELYTLMNRDASGMIVVLIDNPKQMENLHRNHPRLASKFECIGSGEAYEPGEAYDQPVSPVREPKQAVRAEASAPGKAAPKAAVRPLYPERGEAPVRRQPVPPEESYEEDSYEHDIRNAESYETDSYGEEGYEEIPNEEKVHNKKKGLFRNRKKPVYEELEPEESYDENDDYYVEEDEDGENGMTYRNDNGPGSHGEEMDIDEFAQYACRYANEIDCSITGKSMLALYERIEIMEEDGVALTRENAEGLIEEAADRAEKPSFGKRVKGIFSSKYDKDGLLILKEEHFIY